MSVTKLILVPFKKCYLAVISVLGFGIERPVVVPEVVKAESVVQEFSRQSATKQATDEPSSKDALDKRIIPTDGTLLSLTNYKENPECFDLTSSDDSTNIRQTVYPGNRALVSVEIKKL